MAPAACNDRDVDLELLRPGPAPAFIQRLAALLETEPSKSVSIDLLDELDRIASLVEPQSLPPDLLWFLTSFPGARIYCGIDPAEEIRKDSIFAHPRRLLPIASFEGRHVLFVDTCSACQQGADVWLGSCEEQEYGTFEHYGKFAEYLVMLCGGGFENLQIELPPVNCEPQDWPVLEPNTRFVHSTLSTLDLVTAQPGRHWINAAIVGWSTHDVLTVDDGSGPVDLLEPPTSRWGHRVRWDGRPDEAPWLTQLDTESKPPRLSDDRTLPAAAGQRVRLLVQIRSQESPRTYRAVQRRTEPLPFRGFRHEEDTEQRYLWARRLSGATEQGPATVADFESWKIEQQRLQSEDNERRLREYESYLRGYEDYVRDTDGLPD
jgi:hypothetical protein